jgi:hypothetical protein
MALSGRPLLAYAAVFNALGSGVSSLVTSGRNMAPLC